MAFSATESESVRCGCCAGFGYHEPEQNGGTPPCGGKYHYQSDAFECTVCSGNGVVVKDA